MAHFYGMLKGSRGQMTRCGTKDSGIKAVAASYKGAVRVSLIHLDGRDHYIVEGIPWLGAGKRFIIAEGIVGERNGKP